MKGSVIMDEEKVYPTRWQAVGLVVMVLLFMMIVSTIIGGIAGMIGWDYSLENTNVFLYILMTIVTPVVSIGGGIYYVINTKKLSFDYIKGTCLRPSSLFINIVILMLGLSLVLSEVDNLLQRIIPMDQATIETFMGLMNNNFILVFIALCVVAPIFEETLFRGIILRGLIYNIDKWSAIFFNAFLFGMMHLNIWQGITAFVLGIFIGWLFYKTRSLQVAVFAHFTTNLIGILAFYLTDIPGFSSYSETGSQPLWLTLSGLIMIIVGVYLIEVKKSR